VVLLISLTLVARVLTEPSNELPDLTARYNVAPGQMNPVITSHSPNQISDFSLAKSMRLRLAYAFSIRVIEGWMEGSFGCHVLAEVGHA
jgi:hypothetical protein